MRIEKLGNVVTRQEFRRFMYKSEHSLKEFIEQICTEQFFSEIQILQPSCCTVQ